MSFARVTVVGRLGGDPETRYTQNGTLIVSFSMAADGRKRGGDSQPTTTWFRVSAFGEQADRLVKMIERGYIAKGRQLYVEGQLEARPYQGNDGKERTSLDVNLSDWQFINSGQQDGQRGQGGDSSGGNQSGNQDNAAGDRNDSIQESRSSYGGSDYGDRFPSGDEPSDMNDVPF